MINPLLRPLLIDSLFITKSSRSLHEQAEAARAVKLIFTTASTLVTLYFPVFLPIALEYLDAHMAAPEIAQVDHSLAPVSQPSGPGSLGGWSTRVGSSASVSERLADIPDDRTLMSRAFSSPVVRAAGQNPVPLESGAVQRQTFFEREFSRQIVVYLIRSIRVVCTQRFELIHPEINRIVQLLLKIIGQPVRKEVYAATLDCFDKIIDNLGPRESSMLPGLNATLLNLGNRLFSPRLHSFLFKLLGKIGPVEPTRRQSESDVLRRTNESVDVSIRLDNYITQIVADSLNAVLDDRSDVSLHPLAYQALAQTLAECPRSHTSHLIFKQYMNRLLDILMVVSEEERETYFPYLMQLLNLPSEWLQDFAEPLFRLVDKLWESKNKMTLVGLIPVLANSLNEAASPYLPRVTSILLDSLEHNISGDHDLSTRILSSLSEPSGPAWNFVFIILRNIATIISSTAVNPELVVCALQSMRALVLRYDCSSHSSLVLRCCVSVLGLAKFDDLAVSVLSALRRRLGSAGAWGHRSRF
jgi:hypothetical protein